MEILTVFTKYWFLFLVFFLLALALSCRIKSKKYKTKLAALEAKEKSVKEQFSKLFREEQEKKDEFRKRARELADSERSIRKQRYEIELAVSEKASSYRQEYSEQFRKLKSHYEDRLRELDSREARINDTVRQRISEQTISIAHRDYLSQTPVFSALQNDADPQRLSAALTHDMRLSAPFDITSRICSSSGEVYTVSLYSCTCKDFQIRKQPCKHMYRLAAEVGALLSYDTSNLSQRVKTMQSRADELQKQKTLLESESAKLTKKIKADRNAVKKIAAEKSQAYPWLAKMYSDYYLLRDQSFELHLREGKRPALKSADRIKALRQELSQTVRQCKMNEYQLHVYETLFPWLEEFKELSPEDAYASTLAVSDESSGAENEYSTLRDWLSPEEYRALPTVKRLQLALDRYMNRANKTRWEVGIEYERYIGYLCEEKGYRVEYTGARLGVEDMGRDLILSAGDGSKVIIQCKRWAKEKFIHEKHIFQLYGSSILLSSQLPNVTVKAVFVTTAQLSDLARKCSDNLGILVFEQIPFGSYPVIKCNIGSEGEKIYHLPFDQQYDRVVISREHGECYAFTIEEAESKGFRRAYRWRGQ